MSHDCADHPADVVYRSCPRVVADEAADRARAAAWAAYCDLPWWKRVTSRRPRYVGPTALAGIRSTKSN